MENKISKFSEYYMSTCKTLLFTSKYSSTVPAPTSEIINKVVKDDTLDISQTQLNQIYVSIKDVIDIENRYKEVS